MKKLRKYDIDPSEPSAGVVVGMYKDGSPKVVYGNVKKPKLPSEGIDILSIKETLKKNGSNMKELAQKVGVQYTYLSAVLNGSKKPSKEILDRILSHVTPKLPSKEIVKKANSFRAKSCLSEEGLLISCVLGFLDNYASLFEHADELVELVRKERKHRKL